MFFGFDPIHLLIAGGGMILSLAASGYVKYQFNRGKAVPIRSGHTGAEVARMILKQEGVDHVGVVEHQGFLSDHYDPTAKELRLSPDVFHGQTAAAAGVAAHEVGHALQHAQGDMSMWARTILVYPAHFGAMLAPWMVIGGLMLAGGQAVVPGTGSYYLAVAGVFLFGIASLCSIFIVFNEFNASARAKTALVNLGITRPGEEDDAVRGVLLAAGLTYVAAMVIALMELIYWAWRAGLLGGGNRRD